MTEAKYDLEERLLEFAVRVIRVTESMNRSAAGVYVADQLLRSATSPYGHHGEAEGAESRDDFIHKLRICYKELREARRWLRLVHRTPLTAKPELLEGILAEAGEFAHFRRQHPYGRKQSSSSPGETLNAPRLIFNAQ